MVNLFIRKYRKLYVNNYNFNYVSIEFNEKNYHILSFILPYSCKHN